MFKYNVLAYPRRKDTGQVEQQYIIEHKLDYPDADNCYNKNTSGPGTIPYKAMVSQIKYKRLREMLKIHCHKDPKIQKNLFKEAFTSRDRIIYLIDNGHYIQSRVHIEGNADSVEYYKSKMEKDLSWNGKLLKYMPKPESSDFEDIGDGNQSARAVKLVPDMEGLNHIEVPWELHKDILLCDKKSIGNERNAYAIDRQDYVKPEDSKSNVLDIIHEYKLLKNGEVDFDGITLNDRVDELNLLPREKAGIFSELKREFKKDRITHLKEQEGSYDFSDPALKLKGNDLKQYNKILQKIWDKYGGRFDESNTKKIPHDNFGDGQVQSYLSLQHEKIENQGKSERGKSGMGHWIPDLLIVVDFKLKEDYDNFRKEPYGKGREYRIDTMRDAFPYTKLEIEPLPPTNGTFEELLDEGYYESI